MLDFDLWSSLLAPDDILFDSFNLELEPLKRCGLAASDRDYAVARNELLNYLRTRTERPFGVIATSFASDATTPDGEAALTHRITLSGQTVQLPEQLDWCEIRLLVDGMTPNEVITEVNQHDLMRRLAEAYTQTGNAKYARHAVDLMLGWLRQMGPYPRVKFVSDHRAAVFANPAHCRRPHNWTYVFHATIACEAVTDDERIAMLKLMLREVAWMRDNFQGNPSDCLATYLRLLEFADWWPELHNHDKFITFAMNGLFLCLDDFMYADGAYVEQCNYEQLASFLEAAEIARRHNVPLPMDYLEKSVRLFDEFLLMLTKPDGTIPALNDGRPVNLQGLLARAADFYNHSQLKWLATGGSVGSQPVEHSKHFPYAGLFVLRSGWDSDARYLVFDGGRNLGGEQLAHMDKLSFELHAFGETLITDSGSLGVRGDRWRNEYEVATPAHNTVLVDDGWQAQYLPENLDPDQHWHAQGSPYWPGNLWLSDPVLTWHGITWRPLDDNVWQSSDGFDFASAVYDQGYTRDPMSLPDERVAVRHLRAVFYLRPAADAPEYVLLWDALEGSGAHKVESLFHFPPEAEVVSGDGVSLTATVGMATLALAAASTQPLGLSIVKGQLEPLQGWTARDGDHVPSPCAVIRSDPRLPLDLLTALVPARAGELPPVTVTALSFGDPPADELYTDRATGCEVLVGEHCDLFVFSTHPAMPYATRDSRGDEWAVAARACCIRLDADGSVARIHALGAQSIRRNDVTLLSSSALELLDVTYDLGQITVHKRGWGSITLRSFGQTLALVNGDPQTIPPGEEFFEIN